MLNNFNLCRIKVPKEEERTNGGDTLSEVSRPGISPNLMDNHTQLTGQCVTLFYDVIYVLLAHNYLR